MIIFIILGDIFPLYVYISLHCTYYLYWICYHVVYKCCKFRVRTARQVS